MTSFFASIANNFRDHYLKLAGYEAGQTAPKSEQPAVAPELAPVSEPVDSYEPSNETIPVPAENEAPVDDNVSPGSIGSDDSTEQPEDSVESPLQLNPDGTYYSRQARLDYRLDLSFDLGMMRQTIESLVNEDSRAVEELAAAGFGFSADFNVKGKQTVETAISEASDGRNSHQLTKGMANSREIGRFRAQSRALQVDSFYRQASGARRMLDVKEHDGFRRTVNKFGFRLHVDNQFSYSFAERFNVQTERIAADQPDQIGDYINNAGDLALSGSSEMMGSFLDAVDGYLDQTESNLQESVLAAFDAAAAELGFTDEAGTAARQNLASSIEGFFDRVQEALGAIRGEFGLSPQTDDTPIPQIPAQETMVDQKAALLAEA